MEQAPRKGKLTRDKFGASMPVDAPYYQSPPFYYRDARSLTVTGSSPRICSKRAI